MFEKITTAIKRQFQKEFSAPVNQEQKGFAYSAFMGVPGYTPTVTYQSLMNEAYAMNPIVFMAINLIIDKMATIPMKLWRLEGKEIVEVPKHPGLDLLYRPNPIMNYESFIKHWAGFYLLAGNSFVEGVAFSKEGDANLPLQMFPVRPDLIEPVLGAFKIPIKYKVSNEDGRQAREVPVDQTTFFSEIMHVKNFNAKYDGTGISPFSAGGMAVDGYIESQKFGVAYLKNQCVPSGVFYGPPGVQLNKDQIKEIKRTFREEYQGQENTGNVAVFSNGSKFEKQTELPNKDVGLISKDMDAKDICRVLKVPTILLGLPGESAYNNIESAQEGLVTNAVIPPLMEFSSALTNWQFPVKSGYFYAPDLSKVPELRRRQIGSWKAIDEVESLSLNEKREFMGVSKKDGDIYDDVLLDNGQTPAEDYELMNGDGLDETESETLQDDVDEGDKVAFVSGEFKTFALESKAQKRIYQRNFLKLRGKLEKTFQADMENFLSAQGRAVVKAVKGASNESAIEGEIKRAIAGTTPKLEKIFNKHYARIYKSYDSFIKHGMEKSLITMPEIKALSFEEYIAEFIFKNTGTRIKKIQATSVKRVLDNIQGIFLLAQEEGFDQAKLVQSLTEAIPGVYEGFTKHRAQLIARTETGNAANNGARDAVRSMGLTNPHKEWLTADDKVVRDGEDDKGNATADHESMNEKKIRMDEKFAVQGTDGIDYMDGPHDSKAPANQVCNCRCVEAFSNEKGK